MSCAGFYEYWISLFGLELCEDKYWHGLDGHDQILRRRIIDLVPLTSTWLHASSTVCVNCQMAQNLCCIEIYHTIVKFVVLITEIKSLYIILFSPTQNPTSFLVLQTDFNPWSIYWLTLILQGVLKTSL